MGLQFTTMKSYINLECRCEEYLRTRMAINGVKNMSCTCILSVGGAGGGGRIILPVLLSITTTSRRTRRKSFRRVWPEDDHIQTNRWYTNWNTRLHKANLLAERWSKRRSDAVTQFHWGCLLALRYIIYAEQWEMERRVQPSKEKSRRRLYGYCKSLSSFRANGKHSG